MKKVLIINGHPDNESYNHALHQAYKKGALVSGAEVREIKVGELNFNPNLAYGYRKRVELEPDLLQAWEDIKWSDHLVCIYPVWWGSYPALLKGFIDRLFLPGLAFKKREGSVWWDKYLTGKTARIITTMDQPTWFYRLVNRQPSNHSMKKLTMQFVGIKKVGVTAIGPLRLSKDEFRAKWLSKVEVLGRKLK